MAIVKEAKIKLLYQLELTSYITLARVEKSVRKTNNNNNNN